MHLAKCHSTSVRIPNKYNGNQHIITKGIQSFFPPSESLSFADFCALDHVVFILIIISG